ncbi:hypothetical protein FOL46_000335 [Perkinsus olseni]|uniref:Uncharacterized protein n=1 Tax=Perkinsus olseni TaxID=32597 RepID=A0A7J6MIE6_PEROL|nr:hypothetical protein FOL46_000335 [Perkinsus olseni]
MAVPDDVIAGSISEESTKVHVEAADVSDSKDAKSSRGNDDGSSSECGGLGLTASESPEESRSSSLLSSPITSESNSHEEADVVGKNPTVANVTVSSSPRDYAQRGGRGMGLLSATGIMRNYPTTAPPIVKIIKVVILGDAAVGKTSLIQRYMHGSFSHHSYKPTVGADFYSKKLDIIPDQVAGCRCAERFRSLGASFYRGADACILVCDVSRQNGLRNVLDWRRDFLKHADPDEPEKFPFVFVANKTDLPEHAFTESDMIELITGMKEEHLSCPDYPVVMASAENGTGVSQVFELAGAAAVQRANENDRRFSPQGLPGDSDSAGAIMLATGMHSVARQGTCAGC